MLGQTVLTTRGGIGPRTMSVMFSSVAGSTGAVMLDTIRRRVSSSLQPEARESRIIRAKAAPRERRGKSSFKPMYNYSERQPYADVGSDYALASRSTVLGKVLGLLGFAFVFTAGGAVIGRSLGPGAFFISLIGSFGTLIALQFLRERAPLNLLLLYSFATFEGMLLGMILDLYIRS